jgi:hypothetical protein
MSTDRESDDNENDSEFELQGKFRTLAEFLKIENRDHVDVMPSGKHLHLNILHSELNCSKPCIISCKKFKLALAIEEEGEKLVTFSLSCQMPSPPLVNPIAQPKKKRKVSNGEATPNCPIVYRCVGFLKDLHPDSVKSNRPSRKVAGLDFEWKNYLFVFIESKHFIGTTKEINAGEMPYILSHGGHCHLLEAQLSLLSRSTDIRLLVDNNIRKMSLDNIFHLVNRLYPSQKLSMDQLKDYKTLIIDSDDSDFESALRDFLVVTDPLDPLAYSFLVNYQKAANAQFKKSIFSERGRVKLFTTAWLATQASCVRLLHLTVMDKFRFKDGVAIAFYKRDRSSAHLFAIALINGKPDAEVILDALVLYLDVEARLHSDTPRSSRTRYVHILGHDLSGMLSALKPEYAVAQIISPEYVEHDALSLLDYLGAPDHFSESVHNKLIPSLATCLSRDMFEQTWDFFATHLLNDISFPGRLIFLMTFGLRFVADPQFNCWFSGGLCGLFKMGEICLRSVQSSSASISEFFSERFKTAEFLTGESLDNYLCKAVTELQEFCYPTNIEEYASLRCLELSCTLSDAPTVARAVQLRIEARACTSNDRELELSQLNFGRDDVSDFLVYEKENVIKQVAVSDSPHLGLICGPGSIVYKVRVWKKAGLIVKRSVCSCFDWTGVLFCSHTLSFDLITLKDPKAALAHATDWMKKIEERVDYPAGIQLCDPSSYVSSQDLVKLQYVCSPREGSSSFPRLQKPLLYRQVSAADKTQLKLARRISAKIRKPLQALPDKSALLIGGRCDFVRLGVTILNYEQEALLYPRWESDIDPDIVLKEQLSLHAIEPYLAKIRIQIEYLKLQVHASIV